ncbi:tRNA (adenosine(37)-N6)-threonylcarbamoyltransferase complex dimerization subunit type 1 TsaB [Bombilactobacillus mellis]|uniref:tRNA (adenosine(37)-N6)-threonylcarbamoyltransferase complex dimerization subunit type 1 TsaB n=1 Tax=Bombilactobacillus mellis TaxID=1218508 RepID=UPI00157FF3DD|nr:tRNA (adenosine(37)-N6)-threonylcarbamoyltransferase complex dimerization subunit type 1 TsaB [Bombilactobacillus mellis]NUF25598.1 tRNA (adenosine(37)-N6)-threonylcarbamoyltransferase complex dimerization subunit type 1 TsaB [Bombilactobacillus mellis]
MNLLVIDTSNTPLVVATAQDHEIIAQTSDLQKNSHSTNLLPAIDLVTKKAHWQPAMIDRVVVAQGPGSFTGVRIAVTTAKMLAWTLNKELVGISSLAVLARNIHHFTGLVVPFFDARNQNVFAGVYQIDENDNLINVVADQHWSMKVLLDQLKKYSQPITFLGTGMANYQNMIQTVLPQQKIIVHETQPQASSLVELGLKAQPTADLNAFSPIYLRQTQAEAVWVKKHPQASSINYVEDV